MEDTAKWYLMKKDGDDVFGPMPFSQLHQWAVDAFISPLDKVSSDGTTWVKAPMIPELHMDYLVGVEPGSFYGPTTIGAIREFYNSGEISLDTILTNCQSGEAKTLKEFTQVFQPPEAPAPATIRVSARDSLQARVRELEEALVHERFLRNTAEELRGKAEARTAELEDILGIGKNSEDV
ncbi:MAG: hypothetical protein ACFUZC_09330 [Chthoniobacteraceae bacterium]